jgi:hypothetical protein
VLDNLKSKLRDYILRTVRNDGQIKKIEFLESKVAYLNKMVSDIYPDTFIIDDAMKKGIDRFFRAKNLDHPVDLRVSKQDIMFLFNLHKYKGNFYNASVEYMNSGWHQADVIAGILKKGNKNPGELKLLDFASGHGRLTRFLIPWISPSRIWVSDTKKDAVEFQKSNFGVNGFLSSFNPAEVKNPVPFDFIFVASLFSHLNQALFLEWLKTLLGFLNTNGVLCISVVDNSLYNPDKQIDFKYVEYPDHVLQEEMYEVEESSSVKAKDLYGVTYVGESWLKAVLNEMTGGKARLFRYKKALWDLQDVYIITLDPVTDYSGIHFDKYIYT